MAGHDGPDDHSDGGAVITGEAHSKVQPRLDPDQQVQQTMRVLFETFRRTGSASATVKSFRDQGWSFPRRYGQGPRKGEVIWGPLDHPRTLWVVHHPRSAGAFVYGRTHHRTVDRKYRKRPREEWIALIRDAHPAYITWDQFDAQQTMLREHAARHGPDRRQSPPREGPALLQGLVICGKCGRRMTVRYRHVRGTLVPIDRCPRDGIQHGHAACQHITGAPIDEAIGALVIEAVSPLALEVSLGIQQELQTRLADDDKLRGLPDVHERYRQQHDADGTALSDDQRARILALAHDVPRLWRNAAPPARERKRMLRLISEDVTLVTGKDLVVHVRFRGGATRTLTVPRPAPAWAFRQTSPDVVAAIDHLLDEYTDVQIARLLTERGLLGDRQARGHDDGRACPRSLSPQTSLRATP
jgi:hypothetical protein